MAPGEGRDGRRSSALKVAHGVDTTMNRTGPLPVRLDRYLIQRHILLPPPAIGMLPLDDSTGPHAQHARWK